MAAFEPEDKYETTFPCCQKPIHSKAVSSFFRSLGLPRFPCRLLRACELLYICVRVRVRMRASASRAAESLSSSSSGCSARNCQLFLRFDISYTTSLSSSCLLLHNPLPQKSRLSHPLFTPPPRPKCNLGLPPTKRPRPESIGSLSRPAAPVSALGSARPTLLLRCECLLLNAGELERRRLWRAVWELAALGSGGVRESGRVLVCSNHVLQDAVRWLG